jgi:hypothetical protein
MNLASRSNSTIPLPELSRALAAGYLGGTVGMRRFGIFESDLAIDFATDNPAALVTSILEHCTVDHDGHLPEGYFHRLSVGKRLEYLLALAAGEERPPFSFPFHCNGCAQEVEMELTLDEIAEIQREADLIENIDVEIGGQSLSFRKPCGSDQESWAEMVFRDEREAAGAMIGTLAADPDVTKKIRAKDLDLIDEAMDAADPLVNFQCRVGCSECGAENEFLIDLCNVALGKLGRLQKQLIVMVHKLASHYHWSEKEIFEVPHWRRLEYLDLIAAGR